MTNKQPRYCLNLKLWEEPRWINGNYSGKLDVELTVRGGTKREVYNQIKSLLELFKMPELPERDNKGRFISVNNRLEQSHDEK